MRKVNALSDVFVLAVILQETLAKGEKHACLIMKTTFEKVINATASMTNSS